MFNRTVAFRIVRAFPAVNPMTPVLLSEDQTFPSRKVVAMSRGHGNHAPVLGISAGHFPTIDYILFVCFDVFAWR
jgi:hypothetical protein